MNRTREDKGWEALACAVLQRALDDYPSYGSRMFFTKEWCEILMDIARVEGTPEEMLASYLQKKAIRLKARGPKKLMFFTRDQKLQAVAFYLDGHTMKETGRQFGITEKTFQNWIRQYREDEL